MGNWKKRCLTGLLTSALLCTQLVPGGAALTPNRLEAGRAAAQELYELGLFKGTGTLPDGSPNFDLEREATRGEAVTMLVRLLGGEREALYAQYVHPFQDAGWADDYVGYAYYKSISSGTSATAFGTAASIDQAQFLTLVLRALGYAQVDWRDPFPTADQAGLDYVQGEDFCRADIAAICLSALDCRVNGSGETLRERLNRADVFDADGAGGAATPPKAGPVSASVKEITVNRPDEVIGKLAAAVEGREAEILLHVPAGQEEAYSRQISKDFKGLPDVTWANFSWSPGYGVLRANLTYGDGVRAMAYLEGKADTLSQEDMATLNRAKEICAEVTDSSMSPYEQVKAYHDYLVNNNTYQETGDRSHNASGALIDGYAVCDGYSKAFDLLCYLSGIECVRVSGTGNGGGHAWNKVKLNGVWYNVDVTWDDPVSSRPILRYDYFLVSDSTLARDHQWEDYSHWPEAPRDYGR